MKNISKTTGLLAKKLGYKDKSNWWTYYSKENKGWFSSNKEGGISGNEETFKMCTQTQLQTWLRTKGIEVWAQPCFNFSGPRTYSANVYRMNSVGNFPPCTFNSYEKTMEHALKEGLKLLLNDKK